MNTLLKPLAIAAILIAAPVVAHGQHWTQEEWERGIKKEEYARYVRSGAHTALYFFAVTNPDCSPVDGYEVAVTTQPQHGEVTLEPSKEYASWPKENPRSKCNDKKIHGTNWIYRSEKGYRGKDEFEITIYTPTGTVNQRHYVVDVR